MSAPGPVLFLCPHNAAKSVLAAAHFARLAASRGLDVPVASAGTDPASEPAPGVVEALRAEGIDVSAHRPRRVTAGDLATAWRVVSLGCDVGDHLPAGVRVEQWDDIPPPSQNLAGAEAAIRRHPAHLVDEVEAALRPREGGGAP